METPPQLLYRVRGRVGANSILLKTNNGQRYNRDFAPMVSSKIEILFKHLIHNQKGFNSIFLNHSKILKIIYKFVEILHQILIIQTQTRPDYYASLQTQSVDGTRETKSLFFLKEMLMFILDFQKIYRSLGLYIKNMHAFTLFFLIDQ